MFTKIKLTNFRQHTDAEFSFVGGLNVIRGANEAGKSTVFEALAYALFGANSLFQTLEQTVTWGLKETALRVELTFTVNGDTFTVRRSKAGAELDVNLVLQVTGQKEVTKFCENLLGASADAATRLMLANQASLRGALADGPTAAVALIESLANFEVIDEILMLVKEKLPTGNTVALESRIATLDEQVKAPLQDDRPGASVLLDFCKAKVDASNTKLEIARAAVEAMQPEYDRAQALLAEHQHADRLKNEAITALSAAQQRLDGIKVPAKPDVSKIPSLETAITTAANRTALQALHSRLVALPEGDEWDEGAEALDAAITEQRRQLAEVDELVRADLRVVEEQVGTVHQKQLERSGLKAKLIKETHCAFCDKDLTDVPEVTAFNAKLTPQIEALDADIVALNASMEALKVQAAKTAERRGPHLDEIATLEAVVRRATSRASTYQAAAAHIKLDEKYVPARWTWTGPDLSQPVYTGAKAELDAIKAGITAHENATGRYQEAAERVVELQAGMEVALQVAEAAQEASGAVEAVRQDYVELVGVFNDCLREADELKPELREAERALTHAQDMFTERSNNRTLLQKQLDEARQELVDTAFNNVLLKKLQGARPVVANKLWGMVLASVSKYFSSIRGTQSTVTKSEKGFLVDGKVVGPGGLSGSALDALGLAVRIALTKTFLPNTRFMVLDEPAAAADADRETNMIGLIATSDFDQILLVTHSDLADSFASQVIQL